MNISAATVEIIKATANPAEYTANRVTPVDSDALDAALARILVHYTESNLPQKTQVAFFKIKTPPNLHGIICVA
jgi:hypothetical protein